MSRKARMSNPELRAAIIAEIKRAAVKFGRDLPKFSYTTWWARHHIPYTTRQIRIELMAMERDGLVTADRHQPNNTLWTLTGAAL